MKTNPNTAYLFREAGADPSRQSAPELIARHALPLRQTIARWWRELPPEETVAIPVTVVEEVLAEAAKAAVRLRQPVVGIGWLQWKLHSKFRLWTTAGNQPVVQRFAASLERLGVLSVTRSSARFAHPALLELYLALSFGDAFPKPVTKLPRTSLEPLQTVHGRAVLAQLALAPSEDLPALLVEAAKVNLHLAAWFLYYQPKAPDELRTELAEAFLEEIHWDQDAPTLEQLEASLTSLGPPAAEVCRPLAQEREACLPALLAAIRVLGVLGNEEDVPALEKIRQEEALGAWEVDELREQLQEASRILSEPVKLRQEKKEENTQLALQAAGVALNIIGYLLTSRTSHSTSIQPSHDWLSSLGEGLKHAHMPHTPDSDLQTQLKTLRQLIAKLPDLIEKRKGQIAEHAEKIPGATDAAIRRIRQRAGG